MAVIKKPTATSAIQVHYVHADHLNTPRVIVNQSNTPGRWDNVHAFGANLADEDPDGNAQLFEYNPRFSGQYFDKETSLYYNYFRYYEPETGRYISPDPIGLAGGVNVYGYVNGNSMSHRDPLELNPTTAVGAGVGSIIFPGIGTVVGAGVGTALGVGIGWLIYSKPPENAYDPSGPKAPGKPGKEEGFCDPKGGEDWVRNPNGRGSGWRDANGNVWIPSGPPRSGDAHGGPHWDVQTPGGGYINIYPGGKRR
ncbi:polymorphic toxin type 37 domain-containing protein [Nitrosomonas sp. PY1]|uniref:polymorphic toxin type 37 domain-containing protein n=1 Tax=Nitrosomonas sp. PY1 TaxID=1803906 RepID=UPI001FC83650|nr:RHS repeat-associated core domain-containing protein [Nitrosomonas sp. PY1]